MDVSLTFATDDGDLSETVDGFIIARNDDAGWTWGQGTPTEAGTYDYRDVVPTFERDQALFEIRVDYDDNGLTGWVRLFAGTERIILGRLRNADGP